jgi:hypothetical protein
MKRDGDERSPHQRPLRLKENREGLPLNRMEKGNIDTHVIGKSHT